MNQPPEQDAAAVARTIRARKTTKMLSSAALPAARDPGFMSELIELAGWAPFHRACDPAHRVDLPGVVPWRMYPVAADACRTLGRSLPSEKAGKLPAMLASADGLILVTWLPNPSTESGGTQPGAFEPTLANMEHIAAASAATQNLLLAATSRGIANYWSSGGALLRQEATLQRLKIPAQQILLGAIFFFPEASGAAEVVGSKLRDSRPAPDAWSDWRASDALNVP